MRSHRTVSLGLLSASLLLFCATLTAQPHLPHTTPVPAEPAAPQDPLGRSTPRGTVLGFLLAARKGDDKAAAQYLNTTARGDAAATLAHELFVVLDRLLAAKLSQVSDKPEGFLSIPTNPDQDLIGTVTGDNGKVDIVVERVDRGNGLSLWLFSRQTLDAIQGLYQELNAVAVEGVVPNFLRETTIAGIALIEWLAVLVGLPMLYLLIAVLNRLISPLACRILRLLTKRADLFNSDVLPMPVRLLLIALTIRWGLSKVTLPLLARGFWSSTAAIISITAFVWMLIQLNRVAESLFHRRMVRRNRGGAISILRLSRRAVDALILFAGTGRLPLLWSKSHRRAGWTWCRRYRYCVSGSENPRKRNRWNFRRLRPVHTCRGSSESGRSRWSRGTHRLTFDFHTHR
jgi:MscS family membrane protein